LTVLLQPPENVSHRIRQRLTFHGCGCLFSGAEFQDRQASNN
jgi:hypothetical protein